MGESRLMDATGVGIRDTQKLHFYQGAAHRSRDSKGGQGPSWMGLGYRKTKAEGGQKQPERVNFWERGVDPILPLRQAQLRPIVNNGFISSVNVT